MRKRKNFIAQIFWDPKAGMYSFARVFTAWTFLYFVYQNERINAWTDYYIYILHQPPPESFVNLTQILLTWAGGGLVSGGVTYGMNKWASKADPVLRDGDIYGSDQLSSVPDEGINSSNQNKET